MDPNANLREQLELAQRLLSKFEDSDDTTQFDEDDVVRLAELVIHLDEWIRKGGFLPDAWRANNGS